jgi:hypothetical protein
MTMPLIKILKYRVKVVFKPSRKKTLFVGDYIDKLETTHHTLNNFHYY